MDKGRAFHKTSGFTLIEVLVTVVILSIGLLGVAGLQASTIRGTQSAYFRSQAAALGHQIVDAMRANRGAALDDGRYDIGFDEDSTCNNVATCDLNAWQSALGARLPGGKGRISVDADNVATVCIRWSEPERRDNIPASAKACGDVPDGGRQFEIQTVL